MRHGSFWSACFWASYVVVWAFLVAGGAVLMVDSNAPACSPCPAGYNETTVNNAAACIAVIRGVPTAGPSPCAPHHNEAEFALAVVMMLLAALMIGGPTVFVADGNGDVFVC